MSSTSAPRVGRERIAGLVLAAGASRRMGRAKALLPLDGHTYLETAVRTLARADLAPVAVVLGAEADRIWSGTDCPGALRIDNPDWASGMFSSWRAGLSALGALDPPPLAAVVALVDTPRFAATTVRALVRAFRTSGRAVVLPRHRGRHGHPVLVGRELFAEMRRAEPPAEGARAVLQADPSRRLAVDVEDPWILHDADTPADHESMRAGIPPAD